MIIWLKDIKKSDIEAVGGKGANLGEITKFNIPVPNGFVIASDSYKEFMEFNQIDNLISETLNTAVEDEEIKRAASLIRNQILNGSMKKSLEDEIKLNYKKLGDNIRIAVRSSATTEDLMDASFAGQQETYLNVRGISLLIQKIKECYASLWNYRAIKYRQVHGYDQSECSLAVVVQEMIESEKSGVLFTVNPSNNNREEIKINSSYGLGEAIVSGLVTPDEYIYNRKGKEISSFIGSKECQIIYDKDGVKKVPVSEEMKKSRSIGKKELKQLVGLGLKIENIYGFPMDIEWAEKDNKIYILQARAITTLKDKSVKDIKINSLGKNQKKRMRMLLEKVPKAYYPLDFDIAMILSQPKDIIMHEIGIDMEMGLRMDDKGISHIPKDKKSLNSNILHIFSTIKKYKDCNSNYLIGKEKIEGLMKKYKTVNDDEIKSYTIEKCAEELEQLCKDISEALYSRFRYFIFPSLIILHGISKVFKKIDGVYSENDLLFDLKYRTIQIYDELENISYEFSKNDNLKKDIIDGESYENIIKLYPKETQVLKEFVNEFGYKLDFNCYCVTSKSWREDPKSLIQLIRSFLLSDRKDLSGKNKYEKVLNSIKEKVSQKEFEKTKEQIEFFRRSQIYREESQYLWETMFYKFRRIYDRVRTLLEEELLEEQEWLFLHLDELLKVCKEGHINKKLRENISIRKSYRKEAEVTWEQYKLMALENQEGDLKGVSASEGYAEGRVCIIRNHSEFYKLQKGDILVCCYTDPEWTPLFSLASAVVSDTGGTLSHAAIVAREYEIPAVLGTGNATSILKDGDLVKVDAIKGVVVKIANITKML